MPSSSNHFVLRPRLVAGILLVVACDGIVPMLDAPPAPPAEGKLTWRLPPGVEVVVDGASLGATSEGTKVVLEGEHAIAVRSACGIAVGVVRVDAGKRRHVEAKDFVGLDEATLQVTAKDRDGKPLTPSVWVNGWAVSGDVGAGVVVPACRVRLQVGAPDLGQQWEDLTLTPGERVERDLVLLPGSDMVRLPGGPFRMGPPKGWYVSFGCKDPEGCELEGEGGDGWPMLPPADVTVAPFTIDRHEVTAEQFFKCRVLGGCPFEPRREAGVKNPSAPRYCSADFLEKVPLPGRKKWPVTCVAWHEAEDYCRWVGKRLPTEIEWEYAARSGRSDYACAWGTKNGELGCSRLPPPEKPTSMMNDVCTNSDDISEQGVCDTSSGAMEHVVSAPLPGRKHYPDGATCRGARSRQARWVMPFDSTGPCGPLIQEEDLGFRCAR